MRPHTGNNSHVVDTVRTVALLLIFLIRPGLTSRCPKWPEAKETFYYMSLCHNLVGKKMSWSAARDYCAKRGWKLAWADTVDFLKDTKVHYKFLSSVCFWIGATDQVNEGDWRWLDGTPVVNIEWESDIFDFIKQYFADCAAICFGIGNRDVLDIEHASCSDNWAVLCQEVDGNLITDFSRAPVPLPPSERPMEQTFAFVNVFHGKHYRITAEPDFITKTPMLTMCCRQCMEKLKPCVLVNFNKVIPKCHGYSTENVLQSKEKTTEPWLINQYLISESFRR